MPSTRLESGTPSRASNMQNLRPLPVTLWTAVPFSLVATAKHSLEYWSHYPEYYDSWFEGSLGKVTERSEIKKVVKEDAKGLVVGAFAGFVGGLIKGAIGGVLTGGPVGGLAGAASGSLEGAAAGAATGAIGYSAAEAFRK